MMGIVLRPSRRPRLPPERPIAAGCFPSLSVFSQRVPLLPAGGQRPKNEDDDEGL
jgi:hypothetical protein